MRRKYSVVRVFMYPPRDNDHPDTLTTMADSKEKACAQAFALLNGKHGTYEATAA